MLMGCKDSHSGSGWAPGAATGIDGECPGNPVELLDGKQMGGVTIYHKEYGCRAETAHYPCSIFPFLCKQNPRFLRCPTSLAARVCSYKQKSQNGVPGNLWKEG